MFVKICYIDFDSASQLSSQSVRWCQAERQHCPQGFYYEAHLGRQRARGVRELAPRGVQPRQALGSVHGSSAPPYRAASPVRAGKQLPLRQPDGVAENRRLAPGPIPA
ncbi:hypothetical protein BDW22DRAFT_1057518 [Trametopsis cervina]|nr:hypothetical protein BDW22DRAFT_1057518 [Trametopsis cervina]